MADGISDTPVITKEPRLLHEDDDDDDEDDEDDEDDDDDNGHNNDRNIQ